MNRAFSPVRRRPCQRPQLSSLEVTAATFLGRAQQLARDGFGLFDIVDLIYYRGVFHQADALFLRREHLRSSSQLRPIPTGATG